MGNILVGSLSGGIVGFPGFSYTGDCFTRLSIYGDKLYYEWIFYTSGTLTLEKPAKLDFWLVGPGGPGGPGVTYTPSGGDTMLARGGRGGNGSPLTVVGANNLSTCEVEIGITEYDSGHYGSGSLSTSPTVVRIGTSVHTAPAGGKGSTSSGSSPQPIPGTGFTGTYYAYGDEAHPLGAATPPNNAYKAMNGCTALLPAKWSIYDNNPSTVVSVPMADVGAGYGAGGVGGGYQMTAGVGTIMGTAPSSGMPGVVMARTLSRIGVRGATNDFSFIIDSLDQINGEVI